MKNKIFKINLIFLLLIFSVIKSHDENKEELSFNKDLDAIPTKYSEEFGIYIDPQYKLRYGRSVLVDKDRNILPAFQYGMHDSEISDKIAFKARDINHTDEKDEEFNKSRIAFDNLNINKDNYQNLGFPVKMGYKSGEGENKFYFTPVLYLDRKKFDQNINRIFKNYLENKNKRISKEPLDNLFNEHGVFDHFGFKEGVERIKNLGEPSFKNYKNSKRAYIFNNILMDVYGQRLLDNGTLKNI